MTPLITRFETELDFLALHRLNPQAYPVLFESSLACFPHGQWDILFAAAQGEGIYLYADGTTKDARGVVLPEGFFSALDAAWRKEHEGCSASPQNVPVRFIGGWALLFDYEVVAHFEPVVQLHIHPAPTQSVIAIALRCPVALVRDHTDNAVYLVAEPDAYALREQLVQDIQRAIQLPALLPWKPEFSLHEEPAHQFIARVKRALDYLRAGEIFQTNLSRPWQVDYAYRVDPADVFMRLRLHNPAPFAGIFAAHGRCVVSSSPERLVCVDRGVIQTRPIAGTCPRLTEENVHEVVERLKMHPKERAEHVMLIDLSRNDLGRVCVPGSVIVDEYMMIESYAHVHHIVSNVRGSLRLGLGPSDILRAVFPGGSITGCPKIRCMQIITELETQRRAAYTGAMGWLGRNGALDLNILIRTLEVDACSVGFKTGAGIVIDSLPERELEETRAKAKGLLKALT